MLLRIKERIASTYRYNATNLYLICTMTSILKAARMNLSTKRSPMIQFRLHIIIGAMVSIVFILIIARVADKGTPKTRVNIWGIAVVSSLLYISP